MQHGETSRHACSVPDSQSASLKAANKERSLVVMSPFEGKEAEGGAKLWISGL